MVSPPRRADAPVGDLPGADAEPRIRVALLSFNFGQYCIQLANGLASSAEVLLILPERISKPYEFALHPGVRLAQIDLPRLRQPARQARMARRILAVINAFDPNVIHYQAGHMWFNLVWPFYRRYPVVTTIHESRHHLGDRDSNKTPQKIMDLGYRRADRIIVAGEALKRAVMADLGQPAEIIDIVPTLPDMVLREGIAIGSADDDGRSILFFGRIWKYKGLEYLIRAEPLITAEVPDARIVIAGRGENMKRYREMMVNPGHFDIHNDHISDTDLVDHFRRAAVIVLPYVDGSVSGVVPVACIFGKPVVATSVGILPEMVTDRETGLIVSPRDERGLAKAIVELLANPALRHDLGRRARNRAESVFSSTVVAAQTVEVYKRAIAGRSR